MFHFAPTTFGVRAKRNRGAGKVEQGQSGTRAKWNRGKVEQGHYTVEFGTVKWGILERWGNMEQKKYLVWKVSALKQLK